MSPRFFLMLVLMFGLLVPASALGQDEEDLQAKARASVREFEQTLFEQIGGMDVRFQDAEVKVTDTYRASIRTFFAELDSTEMKIEALGMLSGRFVYAVPPDMALSLIGPLLGDQDLAVQRRALEAMRYYTEWAQPSFADRLLPLAKSEDAGIRSRSARVMGQTGLAVFAVPLEQLMVDQDATVRAEAVSAWDGWLSANRMRVILKRTVDPDLKAATNAIALLYHHMPDRDTRRRFDREPKVTYQNTIRYYVKELGPEDLKQFKHALGNAEVSDEFRAVVMK